MRRRPSSRAIACCSWARHRSHVGRSLPAWPFADTARHGLPSRQMTTVHLAGLGSIEAVARCPLLLLRFLEKDNRRVFAFERSGFTKSRRWRRTGLVKK